MIIDLKNLQSKIPHHVAVLFSSFAYVLVAIFLTGNDKIIISFLFLVFITSIFYHSYPHNKYFRLADWIASLSFISYLANFLYVNNITTDFFVDALIFLAVVSIVSWIISFFAFIKNYSLVYNISHTLWHILGAIIIYLIVIYKYL